MGDLYNKGVQNELRALNSIFNSLTLYFIICFSYIEPIRFGVILFDVSVANNRNLGNNEFVA